ncbi:hypothetical protein ACOSP7_003713 [Xanthoceras sorbifolium]
MHGFRVASTNLPMGIDMRERGMRVEDKDSECTHLEMGKPNLVTGRMEFSTFQARRTPVILKRDEQQKKLMMWPR